MTLNDAQLAGLAGLGFTTGTLNDRTLQWLISEGAIAGSTLDDAYMQVLGALGFTGTLNDRLYAYLLDAGYTGTLNDCLLLWWIDGGGFGPQPAKFVADSSDVATNGTTVTVTFNGAVTGSDVLGFTLRRNGIPVSFTGPGAIVSQTTWVLTVTTGGPVDIGDVFSVQYDDVAGTLVTDENALPVLSFGPTQITNNSTQGAPSPVPLTKTVDAAGTTFTVVFDQAMTGNPDLGFTLSGGQALSAGAIVTDTVTWTVDQVYAGEVLTLAYDSGTGDMAGLAQPLATFANAPVTNNSTIQSAAVFVSGVVAASGLSVTITMNKDINGDPALGTSMEAV